MATVEDETTEEIGGRRALRSAQGALRASRDRHVRRPRRSSCDRACRRPARPDRPVHVVAAPRGAWRRDPRAAASRARIQLIDVRDLGAFLLPCRDRAAARGVQRDGAGAAHLDGRPRRGGGRRGTGRALGRGGPRRSSDGARARVRRPAALARRPGVGRLGGARRLARDRGRPELPAARRHGRRHVAGGRRRRRMRVSARTASGSCSRPRPAARTDWRNAGRARPPPTTARRGRQPRSPPGRAHRPPPPAGR